jgi:hypothetical protein
MTNNIKQCDTKTTYNHTINQNNIQQYNTEKQLATIQYRKTTCNNTIQKNNIQQYNTEKQHTTIHYGKAAYNKTTQ